jgi:glyoxylase-like metal-dependent hydrolase (beta-lactamase superfamily II)
MSDLDWFAVRQLGDGITLIAEPGHVNSFLVEGEERTALVDTGMGIGDMAAQVAALTPKPVVAINTHFHFDHTSGNTGFDDVRIHHSGVEQVLTPERPELYDIYIDFSHRMLRAWDGYKSADDDFFHLLAEHPDLRPLPDELDVEAWKAGRAAPVSGLHDGDVLDLGGRQLTVIHTPGHSLDSICLLDDRTGALFTGDTVNTGPVYTQFSESDLPDYADSTRRLADMADAVAVLYVSHFVKYAAGPSLLREHARGFADVMDGTAPFEETTDILGMPAMQARYDGFSIMATAEDLRGLADGDD